MISGIGQFPSDQPDTPQTSRFVPSPLPSPTRNISGYAVDDLEITGISPKYGHRIVEIGVVKLDLDGNAISEDAVLRMAGSSN
ncbi:MAG: hypothetical protein GX483_02465 [Actinomycetaceae bacterium]|nr:hypothetical protein [Actinomycetaceae bacterium]